MPGTSLKSHHAYCLILTRDDLCLALMQYGVVGIHTTSKSGLLVISEMKIPELFLKMLPFILVYTRTVPHPKTLKAGSAGITYVRV